MPLKKLTALMLVFSLILFFGGVTYAAKAKKVSGDVTAADAIAKTVTLKNKAGKEVTLQVTDATSIKKGKEVKTLADIKAGDKLSATYKDVGGKMEAESIQLK